MHVVFLKMGSVPFWVQFHAYPLLIQYVYCLYSRSLGRRPSEDKVSVYLRKPSNESNKDNKENKDKEKDNNADKFMKDMARRSMEIPTDFLDKIEV